MLWSCTFWSVFYQYIRWWRTKKKYIYELPSKSEIDNYPIVFHDQNIETTFSDSTFLIACNTTKHPCLLRVNFYEVLNETWRVNCHFTKLLASQFLYGNVRCFSVFLMYYSTRKIIYFLLFYLIMYILNFSADYHMRYYSFNIHFLCRRLV